MNKRGPRPKTNISTDWRPELAYAVGLITADGSLSKNLRHIDVTSKDKDLLKTIRDCLGIEHIKIGTKLSGNGNKYYRVQFGSVTFYKWLNSIGLHSGKSKSIVKVNIPDKYYFDFFRGVFDGDGTIYTSRDKRWKNCHVVSLGVASGSLKFLKWLKSQNQKQLNVRGNISVGARVLQLRYGRADSILVYKAMYYSKNLPRLERKFAKARKILTIS